MLRRWWVARQRPSYQKSNRYVLDSSAPKTAGFVYLLSDGEGYYKIGRTNSIENRMRAFATEWRVKARLIHVIQTEDMVGLESALHTRFANKRQNGEWFKLTRGDVRAIKRWKT